MTGLPFPDISPEVFSVTLFGATFALRWYALAYIVGIVAGWRLSVAALRRPHLWAGGVAPMTPAQRSYLETLSRQAGAAVDDNLTKAEASKRIDELRGQTGLGDS